jgi:hydroxymethylbilane synthase
VTPPPDSSAPASGGTTLPDRVLRLATRGSRLALWQAEHVAERLRTAQPNLRVERVVLGTTGDRVRDRALSAVGERGLFTRELEQALCDRRVDVAVHSLKDLPTQFAAGLVLGAVLEREDPRDALLSRSGDGLQELPRGARIGTSSLRRRSQLLAARPDLEVRDLRGNLPTRIARLDHGDFDAIVLARAGLVRLRLAGRISEVLDARVMLPAVGQGALAVQCRADDERAKALLGGLDHAPTRLATAAERALLARLESGCQVPAGALARFAGESLTLDAYVGDVDGSAGVRKRGAAAAADERAARALGVAVAEALLEAGAQPILSRLREAVSERAAAGALWEEA